MAEYLGQWTPGSPEWHAARQRRIGGSEIGIICGWSPYPDQSRQKLLHRKAGLLAPTGDSSAKRRGHYCEGAVLSFLADKHDLTYAPDLSAQTFVHDRYDWALFNPDAVVVGGAAIAEAKTTTDRTKHTEPMYAWGRAGTDQIPYLYLAQVQWGMAILGATECYVGVLHGATNGRPDLDFASYRVRFDPDIFTHLLDAGRRFMADLDNLLERTAA